MTFDLPALQPAILATAASKQTLPEHVARPPHAIAPPDQDEMAT